MKSSSSEEMRSKLKAFKFDDDFGSGHPRSRPGALSLNNNSGGSSNCRFASEQESKLREIMSQTGLLQTKNGCKIKTRIEDFELLGDLGNGTCGHVVKMIHRPSGTILAVKQMRRTGNSDENKRIIMDLDVVLKSHDCREIVLCLGCFITDSDVWICMELMSTCFDKLLKQLKQPIPEDICGKVAVATLKALDYLKERHGVIHRDVKPSNILLESSGRVKLCDFGISGRLVDSKAKTRSAGCAAYMAPERIDPPNPSSPDYDIRADVWSLGITLVELATGYFPYRDCKTDFEVLTKVLQDDPPLLPRNGGFSMEFRSFVKDCLMKNYKDRPKYKKLLMHPFILKYEQMDVDVGAWYRSKTESLEVAASSSSSSPPAAAACSTSPSTEPVTFKPQPSPRVVRSSRRPPPSVYPSAMNRFTSSAATTSSTVSTTTSTNNDPSSSVMRHYYDSRRYPSNGGASAYSLLNSSRSPQYSSSGPTSLPETSMRPSVTPRYRESPRVARKFDFTFPTTLHGSSSVGDHQDRGAAYSSHNYHHHLGTSEDASRGYPGGLSRMTHHHRPSLGGEASSSQRQPRSPSHERPSSTATARSNLPSSGSGSSFSWRNILQSPMSLRRLRTSSTDRSSAFDSARRFQPSYRSWNNEKDNYFSSTKR